MRQPRKLEPRLANLSHSFSVGGLETLCETTHAAWDIPAFSRGSQFPLVWVCKHAYLRSHRRKDRPQLGRLIGNQCQPFHRLDDLACAQIRQRRRALLGRVLWIHLQLPVLDLPTQNAQHSWRMLPRVQLFPFKIQLPLELNSFGRLRFI